MVPWARVLKYLYESLSLLGTKHWKADSLVFRHYHGSRRPRLFRLQRMADIYLSIEEGYDAGSSHSLIRGTINTTVITCGDRFTAISKQCGQLPIVIQKMNAMQILLCQVDNTAQCVSVLANCAEITDTLLWYFIAKAIELYGSKIAAMKYKNLQT